MIKKFFLSMLGSLAALWISMFLLVLGGIFTCAAIFSSLSSSSVKTDVKKNSILYLNLTGDIVDRYQPGSFLDEIQEFDVDKAALEDIINALGKASSDKKIDGLYINAAGASLSYAGRGEIIQAIQDFKKSGKWVYAYGDTYAQGDYYICSAADSVFVNPVGAIEFNGIGGQIMFYKGLLDKLDIQVQIFRVGKFKSAVEPFLQNEMSEASRLQNQTYIDGTWDIVTDAVAQNRHIDVATLKAMADSIPMTFAPERYLELGLVDALRYRHQVEDRLRTLTNVDKDKDLNLVTPAQYMESNTENKSGKDHIAVLYALGDISDEGESGITSEKLVPEILSLAQNDKVKALVMRVNSPGGSAFASEQIWEALQVFKKTGKPFYVSMGGVAASGGYYISCGADKIYADPATITGSIGIFGMIPNINGLLTKKLGLGLSTVATNPNAGFPSITSPITPFQRQQMQSYIERGYETFVGRCAEGRHMEVDSIKAIAEGRVWLGTDALKIGLVDELATLKDVIKDMSAKVNLEPTQVVTYPSYEDNPMLTFMRLAQQSQILAGITDSNSTEATKAYGEIVKIFTELSPVQARMETVIIK